MCSRTLACIAIVLATLVAGCQHSTRSNATEPVASQARPPGYKAEQRYATTSILEAWTLAGEPVEMTLVRPTGNDVFPLVIYLPGLGEPSSAGAAWRQAWAHAGYAVLSLQSVANGETLWSSPQARSGDFPDLARVHFSRLALARRLATLRTLFEELTRRHDSGALRGVDMSRIALAGFDLGAQTVMAAAGEMGYDTETFTLPGAVKCVIVLSPYADSGGAGFGQRFAAIHGPVLSVTSMDDTDSYGLVTAATMRRVPFENMPPGQKYLLSLVNAPHALIAGKETPSADNSVVTQDESPRSTSGDSTDQGRGTGRRGGAGGGSQRGRHGGGNPSADTRSSSTPLISAVAWAAKLMEVQSVTTAYLDMNLKNDGVAGEWLTRDARRWLGEEADLIVR
jgi:dienelactone hydrolase